MNKKISKTIGGLIIAIAIIFSTISIVYSATTVEKIDDNTVNVIAPMAVKIADLKSQLAQYQVEKNKKQLGCDQYIQITQTKIDDVKDLIQKAKLVGVQ